MAEDGKARKVPVVGPVDRRLAVAFLAYFFYTLWVHFNFYQFDAMVLDEPVSSSLSYMTSVYVNGAALVAMALLHKRYEPHAFSSGVVVAPIFLCALGTLMATSSGLFAERNPLVDFLGGALSGMGSAALLVMLAILLVENGRFAPVVMFAFLLANAAAVPLAWLPPAALLVMVVLMPVASITCAIVARGEADAPARGDQAASEDVARLLPLVARALVFVFVVYAGISVSNAYAQSTGVAPDSAALLLATLLVCAVFTLSVATEGHKLNIVSVYRTVFFCALVGLFSVPFFEGNFAISYGIVAVLTTVVRAFIFLVEYRICVKTGLSPVLVFGIGETAKKLPGLIVRGALAAVPAAQVNADPTLFIRLFILVGLALAAVYVLVFTEKHLLRLSKDEITLSTADLLERKRTEVAQRHELTEREMEVFLHLCDGRSAPWIAKELYISQATVNVHVKNIYRKCDVHSRQELLDLVK